MEPQKIRANNAISLNKYFTAVKNHVYQAKAYDRIGDYQRAYALWFKAASLVIETIPKHQDAREPRYQRQQAEYAKHVRTVVMPRLEQLKAGPMSRAASAPVRQTAIKASQGNMPSVNWQQYQPTLAVQQKLPADYFVSAPIVDHAIASSSRQPPPHMLDPDPFAASAAFSGSAALPPAATVNAGNVASLPSWMTELTLQHASGSYSTGSKHSLSMRGPRSDQPSAGAQRPQYPRIEAPAPVAAPQPPRNVPLPPQELEVKQQVVTDVVAPPPGATCDHSHHTCEHAHPTTPAAPAPAGDKDSEGALFSDEIRNVYLHPGIMDEFLAVAQRNTRRGIETAGLLAGTFSARENSFSISRLFIPKQKGEPNNVEMLSEEDLVEHFFDEANESVLVILGWIHTHPTQSCFLSSIDVHTQCGYQTGSAEAMAIVMAPTDPRCKCNIFRLTTPGGLKLIQGCDQRGFHAHGPTETGQEIFELCGHVFLDETAKFKTVDLR